MRWCNKLLNTNIAIFGIDFVFFESTLTRGFFLNLYTIYELMNKHCCYHAAIFEIKITMNGNHRACAQKKMLTNVEIWRCEGRIELYLPFACRTCCT